MIASLRDRPFATLPELRAAIYERDTAYNAEPFQKRVGSRAGVFEAEEKPLLRPLPQVPFKISRWGLSFHVTGTGRGGRLSRLSGLSILVATQPASMRGVRT